MHAEVARSYLTFCDFFFFPANMKECRGADGGKAHDKKEFYPNSLKRTVEHMDCD